MDGGIKTFVKNPGGSLTGSKYGTGDCFVKLVALSIASFLTSVVLIYPMPLMLLQTLLSPL